MQIASRPLGLKPKIGVSSVAELGNSAMIPHARRLVKKIDLASRIFLKSQLDFLKITVSVKEMIANYGKLGVS
mgnify:CR=1 FL=1